MAFLGNTFSYNGTSSEDYSMVIGQFSGRSSNTKLGTNLSIISDKIVRLDKQYVYGFEYDDVLKYDVELVLSDILCTGDVPHHLDAETRREIENWLFGRKEYNKFVIEDDDMDGLYYNAILMDAETINVDGYVIGYKFTLVNDSPFAYSNSKKIRKAELTGTNILNVLNSSDRYGYTYPIVKFKLSAGDTIVIKNKTDNDREFKFTGLNTSEEITVDNARQIITSSSGALVSSNFNKNFLRLLQNKNELEITGDIESLYIEFEVCRQGAV